jgi:glyoxylate carboligase
VKSWSFTAGPRGWSLATPAGFVTAEPGQQVVIVARESWEKAIREAVDELMKVDASLSGASNET